VKKNTLTLLIFLIFGLLLGSILGELLSTVKGLQFLTKSSEIRWEPMADLNVIQYDLKFLVKLNLISIIGLLAAIWLYRKL
jgi:hypothetical protein